MYTFSFWLRESIFLGSVLYEGNIYFDVLFWQVAYFSRRRLVNRMAKSNKSLGKYKTMGRYGSAWGRMDALWCALTIIRERRQQFLYGSHRTSVTRSSFSLANLLVPLRKRERWYGRGSSTTLYSVNRETDRSNTKTAYFTRVSKIGCACETTKSVAPLNDSSRTEILTASVRAFRVDVQVYNANVAWGHSLGYTFHYTFITRKFRKLVE